eukprot:1526171-Amphidinium_carterae.1
MQRASIQLQTWRLHAPSLQRFVSIAVRRVELQFFGQTVQGLLGADTILCLPRAKAMKAQRAQLTERTLKRSQRKRWSTQKTYIGQLSGMWVQKRDACGVRAFAVTDRLLDYITPKWRPDLLVQ